MTPAAAYTLVNPQNGNLAFKVFSFAGHGYFDHIQRLNYYSLVWVRTGNGKLTADFLEYSFGNNTLFAFAPYQPFMLHTGEATEGTAIHFHPDFFCIHKHQHEVACNGVLFNNIYQPPFVLPDNVAAATLEMLIGQMQTEMQNAALAQYELLVAYLKIFLITASRLKLAAAPVSDTAAAGKEPFVLQNLKNFIELHYKTKHSASDYAALLNISAGALARITKTHFNKTLSSLINERIIIEAKRELYLTNKPVKEIASNLGYEDEYYFSRFFKVNAAVSPQMYRNTVGFGRGAP